MKMYINPQFKLPLHVVQLFLIVVATGFTAPRMFMKNQPRTRANTIALGMGAKSIIIIQYQLLVEHVRRCHKWHSYKAILILNSLEIIFWAAVAFLVIQGNLSVCIGVMCKLSWAVVGIAIVLTLLDVYMAGISFVEYRANKHRLREETKETAFGPQSQRTRKQSVPCPTVTQGPRGPHNEMLP